MISLADQETVAADSPRDSEFQAKNTAASEALRKHVATTPLTK
jgi:hypothetical protein